MISLGFRVKGFHFFEGQYLAGEPSQDYEAYWNNPDHIGSPASWSGDKTKPVSLETAKILQTYTNYGKIVEVLVCEDPEDNRTIERDWDPNVHQGLPTECPACTKR